MNIMLRRIRTKQTLSSSNLYLKNAKSLRKDLTSIRYPLTRNLGRFQTHARSEDVTYRNKSNLSSIATTKRNLKRRLEDRQTNHTNQRLAKELIQPV